MYGGGAEAGRAILRPRIRIAPRPAAAWQRRAAPLPFELAAFARDTDPALLEATARRAEILRIGGDEVVRAHGLLAPDEMLVALADHLGLEIDFLDDDEALDADRILGAALTGVLRRPAANGSEGITVTPRGIGIARLAAALDENPRLAESLRLSSPERLSSYVRRVGAAALAREAVLGLHQRRPDLSASAAGGRGLIALTAICSAGPLAGAALYPTEMLLAAEFAFGGSFLAWAGFRLRACFLCPPPTAPLAILERNLPVYTIVVPLYREAHMVRPLVSALRRLNYPLEKLDVKLVVEADDPDTRLAVHRLKLGAPFEEIVAPLAGPRTKPKALAAALPFARGSFLVVYDAEDQPDADQLRQALAAFRGAPPELACVQARLAIDNADDNWLTRQYAAEYAGLFDAFLPALAARRLPIPLGGTSNHFRTAVLRRVGGWDPFNVTEDTDLGMRLARFGYHIGVIASTTDEEAPSAFRPWLRQRTRWFKGWIQTFFVHMRSPPRLLRDLGFKGFLAFQLLVAGTVLAALVHPFFLGLLIYDAATGALFTAGDGGIETLRRGLALAVLVAGYLASASLALIGLCRRGMLRLAPVLLTIPIYWLLLSLAAWRALGHFAFAPYRWEKTEHGFARTSRRLAGKKAEQAAPRTAIAVRTGRRFQGAPAVPTRDSLRSRRD